MAEVNTGLKTPEAGAKAPQVEIPKAAGPKLAQEAGAASSTKRGIEMIAKIDAPPQQGPDGGVGQVLVDAPRVEGVDVKGGDGNTESAVNQSSEGKAEAAAPANQKADKDDPRFGQRYFRRGGQPPKGGGPGGPSSGGPGNRGPDNTPSGGDSLPGPDNKATSTEDLRSRFNILNKKNDVGSMTPADHAEYQIIAAALDERRANLRDELKNGTIDKATYDAERSKTFSDKINVSSPGAEAQPQDRPDASGDTPAATGEAPLDARAQMDALREQKATMTDAEYSVAMDKIIAEQGFPEAQAADIAESTDAQVDAPREAQPDAMTPREVADQINNLEARKGELSDQERQQLKDLKTKQILDLQERINQNKAQHAESSTTDAGTGKAGAETSSPSGKKDYDDGSLTPEEQRVMDKYEKGELSDRPDDPEWDTWQRVMDRTYPPDQEQSATAPSTEDQSGKTVDQKASRKDRKAAEDRITADRNNGKISDREYLDHMRELNAGKIPEAYQQGNAEQSSLTPEQQARQQAVREKFQRGEQLSDEEYQALEDGFAAENPDFKKDVEASKDQDPTEARLEKLGQEIEDLGTDIMFRWANGIEVDQADLEKFQAMRGEQQLLQVKFTPEQARELVKAALEKNGGPNERRAEKNSKLQQKIQELMTIDMQILAIPKNVDQLRRQRQKVQAEARIAHMKANTPEGRQKEYSLYMQIANINEAISSQKYEVVRLGAKRGKLEADVRRATGVSGPMQSVVEFATSRIKSIMVTLGTGIAEEASSRTQSYAR
ncbi:MAG TPA: hypothetical protein VLF93_01370 [Candidatus Saccharimonadales bacterium]|nr:hypothetical protein [Candidatus Saccharimonadales bacterium]